MVYDNFPTVWSTEEGVTFYNIPDDELERVYKVPKEWIEAKGDSDTIFVAARVVKKGEVEALEFVTISEYEDAASMKMEAVSEAPMEEVSI